MHGLSYIRAVDVSKTVHPSRISDILRAYRAQAIADATGRSRTVAHDWRTGRGLPDVASLPALARLLRMDLADLTNLVAHESSRTDRRIDGRRAS